MKTLLSPKNPTVATPNPHASAPPESSLEPGPDFGRGPYNYLAQNIYALLGFGILTLFFLTALLAGPVSPHDLHYSHTPFLEPSPEHPLGTNDLGYDILTELLHASRVSIAIGLLAALVSAMIGTVIGLISGYFRGAWGELMTGMIDIFLLIPFLPLMVILAAYFGQSIWNIVLVISLLGWCSTARVVRAKVLQLRETPFIEALKALDIPEKRILFRHILPNVLEVISAKFVLATSSAMLSEAALSFLGLGDPTRISWGAMIHYAFQRGGFANGMWYWYLPPGICIGGCAMGFVLLGLHFERRQQVNIMGRNLF